MLHLSRILLIGLIVAMAMTASAGADSVTIRLADGDIWRGDIGDQIHVTYDRGGREIEFEGTLTEAEDRYIMVEGELAGEIRRRTIFIRDIASIERLGERDVDEDRVERDRDDRERDDDAARTEEDVPGVFKLPMEGMVGTYFRHHELKQLGEYIDENYGPGQIIVLRMDSGGGTLEMRNVHETIMELRERHRVVAWVERALSAAAASAIACDEIYFTRNGTLGAMTGYMGDTALQDEELEEWMTYARRWMENGGREGIIADAMIHAPAMLSYDRDEETGEVTWYNDLRGEYELSNDEQVLTFTSRTAMHSGFGSGVADTKEDLAELLDLPYWNEISSKGRELFESWHRQLQRAEDRIERIQEELSRLPSEPEAALTMQLRLYQELLNLRRRLSPEGGGAHEGSSVPNTADAIGIPGKNDLRRMIAELEKQISDLRRQG